MSHYHSQWRVQSANYSKGSPDWLSTHVTHNSPNKFKLWVYQTLATPILHSPGLYIQWGEHRILLLIQTNSDWHFTWTIQLNTAVTTYTQFYHLTSHLGHIV